MNILFSVPRYHTNQICWINTLKKQHNVFMLVSHKGFSENYSNLNPDLLNQSMLSKFLKFIFHDKKNKLLFPSFILVLRYIFKKKIDIIIIRDLNRILSIYTLIIGILLSKKIIIYSQTDLHKNITKRKKFFLNIILFKKNIKWATPLIGELKYPIQHNKMYFLPFCADNHIASKQNKKFNLLCVSKFTKRKNLFSLLELTKHLKNNEFDFELNIVGEVTTHEHKKIYDILSSKIKNNNLSKHIKLFSNVKHNNINKFYQKSNLFILPAYNEPASYSVIEAISFKIPVICSDTCGTRHYIKNNGEIFKSKSTKSLIYKTVNLLNNYEKFYNETMKSYQDIKPENFMKHFSRIIK